LFEIFFGNNRAKKDYENLDEKMRARVNELCEVLKDVPVPFKLYDVRKVAGEENIFRIRIGKYRVVYKIAEKENKIRIVEIEQKDETTYKFHN